MAPSKNKSYKENGKSSLKKSDPDYERKRKKNNEAVQKSRAKYKLAMDALHQEEALLIEQSKQLDMEIVEHNENVMHKIAEAEKFTGCPKEEILKLLDQFDHLDAATAAHMMMEKIMKGMVTRTALRL